MIDWPLKVLISGLVVFAGWTVGTNIVVLCGGSLADLTFVGPLAALAAVAGMRLIEQRRSLPTAMESTSRQVVWEDAAGPSPTRWLLVSGLVTASLIVSWTCFWVLAVTALAALVLSGTRLPEKILHDRPPAYAMAALAALCAANALLAYVTSRPDQDDAFYVGLAAFASGHPHEPLLAFDPMLVERSWPLIFPSYRFASFELLAAWIAHACSLNALTIAHVVLPPIAACFATLATFGLARELRAGNAWLVTAVALVLTILMGEQARSPANFAFDRIFQGKAILLSVVLPSIYLFTLKHVRSPQGGRYLYVLVCTYFAAIGISNFGMLIAPLVGITAALSASATGGRLVIRSSLQAASCSVLCLPYLIWVAVRSHVGATFVDVPSDAPELVWSSTFGTYGKYLTAFLLVSAPALASCRSTRMMTAIPSLLTLGIALNPVLGPLISRYVTTPPVYWRVTWVVPTFVYMAAAATMVHHIVQGWNALATATRVALAASVTLIGGLTLAISPFNTLRASNGTSWAPGQPKLVMEDMHTADAAMRWMPPHGRLLAPDEISSIVAMHEQHPQLVAARSMYIYMLRDSVPADEYQRRMRMVGWVNQTGTVTPEQLRNDFAALNVAGVVLKSTASIAQSRELRDLGFVPIRDIALQNRNWVRPRLSQP